MKNQSDQERFWAKVRKTDGCWEWTACVIKSGYGQAFVDGKKKYAHRHAYELLVGPIPKGLVLDHLCWNRKCVNPDHLEAVTQRANVSRERRDPRLLKDIGSTRVEHGTLSMYTYYKCKCEPCKVANTEWHRDYQARLRITTNKP